MIVDDVPVMSLRRAEACMKVLVCCGQPQYTDIVRQVGIASTQPVVARSHGLGVKMNNLPGRMYTGIRTPGTDYINLVVGHH